MAAQIESGNQLQELLGILSRRKWQIIVPALYVMSIGVAVAAFLPRVYRAYAQVNVFETRVEATAFAGDPLAGSGGRETTNAAAQIKQDNRIRQVLDELEWPEYMQLDEARRFRYRERLRDSLTVHVVPKPRNEGSTFIDLAFESGDPRRAEQFLQNLSLRWLKDVYERDEMNRRRERDVLQEQRAERQRELVLLREEFATRLKASGLTLDQLSGPQRYGPPQDPLIARVAQGEVSLLEARRKLEQQRARVAVLQREFDNAPVTLAEPAEVGGASQAAKIETIRGLIAEERKKQVGLQRQHPRYAIAEEQIRRYEREIETLRGQERRGEIVLRPVANPDRERLRAELVLEKQEEASLERDVAFYEERLEDDQALQAERVDLRMRLEELKLAIDARQELYEEIDRKYAQQQQTLEIMRRAVQPYEITQEARAHETPVRPNVPLIWLFAALGGLGLGLAIAGVAEFTQAGYRTPSDLARALDVPVLGVIQEVPTRATRRERLLRRSVVAVCTLLILGGVHWFAWTLTNHPERLGTDVRQALEDVREQLR